MDQATNQATEARRRFLRLAGGAATALALPPFSTRADEVSWAARFEAADKAGVSWTLGYRTAEDNQAAPATEIIGTFPRAVHGDLFRNGAAGHDLGGVRYHHWFDGDGMLNRFRIRGNTVEHLGRFVQTPKRVAEQKAGHRLVEAFGTKLPDLIPVSAPDVVNVANTSVVPFQGELLALWEGGSACRVDPETLTTLGMKNWRDDLVGLPFSAHPKFDSDGTMWNFGVGSGQGKLVIYQIGSDGSLKRAEALPVEDVPMIHDFAITQRHLIFLMPPLVMDREAFQTQSFLDSHRWMPELGMRVLVIDKDNWQQRQIFQLPAGFLFHIGNAWEDSSGQIRVDYVHADTPEMLFHTGRDVMRGVYNSPPPPLLATLTLDTTTNKARQEILDVDGEFPRIDTRLTGLRHREVVHATRMVKGRPGFSAIGVTNIETGSTRRYVYGDQFMAEEHIVVTARSGQKLILGTVLDLNRKCTWLHCLDYQHVADGPIASASLPYALPLGLHGNFIGV